jgi:cell division protein ZipA
MDKEILRIIIISTGLFIIVGILLWSYIKNKQAQTGDSLYDDELPAKRPRREPIADDNDDDIITAPIAPQFSSYEEEGEDDEFDDFEPPPRAVAPTLIQFSIVARSEYGFNGEDVVAALESAGLVYGSNKIFEKLDANRLVDFGVACMSGNGTFPDRDLDKFYCAGIVLFMQPSVLDDAVAVFDQYIDTIDMLTTDLDGIVWDNHNETLTLETVRDIRRSL